MPSFPNRLIYACLSKHFFCVGAAQGELRGDAADVGGLHRPAHRQETRLHRRVVPDDMQADLRMGGREGGGGGGGAKRQTEQSWHARHVDVNRNEEAAKRETKTLNTN